VSYRWASRYKHLTACALSIQYRTELNLSKPDTEKIVEENVLHNPSRQDKLIIQNIAIAKEV